MRKHYFSIIIPCFNVSSYLPRCLDSIINQTFSDIEIIMF
ncbi:MAG: glycosyltransferase [Bacteroidales bacterium]|nr:glycosyltransferase [Bacteroidales bacterium]